MIVSLHSSVQIWKTFKSALFELKRTLGFYVLCFEVQGYLNFSELFLENILKIGGHNYDQNFSLFAVSLKFVFSVACSRHNETAVSDCTACSNCLFSLLGDHMAPESPPSFIQNRHGPAPCSFPPSLSLPQIVIQTVNPPLMCSLTSHGHTVNFI